MNKKKYIEKALNWAKKRATSNLKAKHGDYEEPKIFTNVRTNENIQADISFTTAGGTKNYSDIALKTDNTNKLITKWKLLSQMAALKNGKLFLMVARGHKMFTQRLLNKYNINAELISI